MADNSTQGGADTIRDKDRVGVKTQIFGVDLNIGGASEVLQTAAALADATANPTVPAWAALGLLFNGTTWDRMRGDTTNGLDVDVTRLPGSPAQEHTTAASPNGARLSDGAAFYNTNTGAQLPASLGQKTMANSLGVAIASDQTAVPVSLASVPTVTEKQDQPTATAATWTSATALNTAVTVTTTGYGTANVFIVVPTTTTAGVITLEVSNDGGTTYVPSGAVRVDNGVQENTVSLPFAPGINGSRMYAVSVDAMTQVRARLSTVIVGAGNVVVTVSTVAGGIEPFVATRARKAPTYYAAYRVAARSYRLTFTFTANTRKQFATIHHAAAATKTVRLRSVQVLPISAGTAATDLNIELIKINTAPATGNPTITPVVPDGADPAAETTCLALPTTGGTETGAPLGIHYIPLGITGAAGTTNPPPSPQWIELIPKGLVDDEQKLPAIRAGVLEGWAVTLDSTGASAVFCMIQMVFTEEAP